MKGYFCDVSQFLSCSGGSSCQPLSLTWVPGWSTSSESWQLTALEQESRAHPPKRPAPKKCVCITSFAANGGTKLFSNDVLYMWKTAIRFLQRTFLYQCISQSSPFPQDGKKHMSELNSQQVDWYPAASVKQLHPCVCRKEKTSPF